MLALVPRKTATYEQVAAKKDKSELLDYVADLESENSDLQDMLDSISDIVAGPSDTDSDDDDYDSDDDGD